MAPKEAATRGFYTFENEDDPESYHGWVGVKTLPTLDYSQRELRRRIYEADDAVFALLAASALPN